MCWPLALPVVTDREVLGLLPDEATSAPALEVVAERAIEERNLVRDHNDALDRKLTTMITALGAYFGLVGGSLIISDEFTGQRAWAIAALSLVAAGVALALYGLTPRAFGGVDVEWLLTHAIGDEPGTVTLLMAREDQYVAELGRRILTVKGCILRRTGWLLVLSLLLTVVAILTDRT